MIIVLMGPTGAGKTTVGTLLATQIGWQFVDGDFFHPQSNIDKMARGIPLDDTDRMPWIASIRSAIVEYIAKRQNIVLACSALKRIYREQLYLSSEVKFVYLKGSYELLKQRLQSRHGHFASDKILAGQFRDMEEPDDVAVTVIVTSTPAAIVSELRKRLALT